MSQTLIPFDLSLFAAAFGAGLGLILALMIARDFFQSLAARLFILLLLVAITHLFHTWLPADIHGYSYIVQSAAPALFWMCCRVTFVDPDEPRYLLWPIAFYSFMAPLIFQLIDRPTALFFLLKGLPQWFEYLLILAGLWEVTSNWNHDLVEARRRLRGGIMLGVGLAVGWSILSFNLHIGGATSRYFAIDLAILTLAWLLLQGRSELWQLIPQVSENRTSAVATENPESRSIVPSSHTKEELNQLQKLMESGFYRQENLTLTLLARQLGIPEYRLRSAINKALDYNNFNEYINDLRIAEAAERLAKEPETPITNIALDVGYRTMSSFNRAFRKIHNSTPSDYREHNRPT